MIDKFKINEILKCFSEVIVVPELLFKDLYKSLNEDRKDMFWKLMIKRGVATEEAVTEFKK